MTGWPKALRNVARTTCVVKKICLSFIVLYFLWRKQNGAVEPSVGNWPDRILEGAVPAAVLALVVQGLFELAERRLVPKGLRLKPE